MDKVSRNALVWCAMWGDPFMSSACSSFALLWRNLGRVAAIHIVSDIMLGIGKIAIACMSIGVAAIVIQNVAPWRTTVSSAIVPCIVVGFVGYLVAWMFFLTFSTVIDTIFLCFLVDAENSEKAGGEAMFASKSLQTLVGKYQSRSAIIAEEEKKPHPRESQVRDNSQPDTDPTSHQQVVISGASAGQHDAVQPQQAGQAEHRSAWGNDK
jgi:hypothetical protein